MTTPRPLPPITLIGQPVATIPSSLAVTFVYLSFHLSISLPLLLVQSPGETTFAWTMYHVCDRPLKFSDCHGCNVIVKSSGTLAEGRYLYAQGQFITKGVLRLVRPFQLIFQGKGRKQSNPVVWSKGSFYSGLTARRGCTEVKA